MILRRLVRTVNRQDGFTLVEMLVVVALTGVLATAITAVTWQILSVNLSGTARMTAIKQVERAIYSIRQDIQMAQKVELGEEASGFPMVLTWTEWDNTRNEVTYSLIDNGLRRQLSVNGGIPTQSTVGRNIETITLDNKDGYTSGKLIITIASTVGGLRSVTESRKLEVLPRISMK